eukprot:gene13299-14608_t
MTSYINILPFVMIKLISEYLSSQEIEKFLNVSDHARTQWKKHLIQLILNKEHSILFLTDSTFHAIVRNAVGNPKSQISLVLDGATISKGDLCNGSALNDLHTVRWHNCSDLPSLDLFVGVSSIDFSSSVGFINLSGLPSSVKHVNLSYCASILDAEPLAYCETVSLRGCSHVANLSALRSVPYLNLSCCSWLEDEHIIELGHQKELNLSFCTQIRNVAHLNHVEKLNLNYCNQIPFEMIDSLKKSGNFITPIR